MMSIHDALQAWQDGEMTASRAMQLSGALDVLELYGLADACGVRIRLEPREDEASVAESVTRAIRRVTVPDDGGAGDGPGGMKAA